MITRFHITPFDLHVLGTPPAFILSQDQTLMLNVVCSCQCYLAFRIRFRPTPSNPFRSSVSCFTKFGSWFDYVKFVLWIFFRPGPQRGTRTSGIFRVALLFICQGSKRPIGLCRFQRQLWYNIMSVSLCQQVFEIFLIFFFSPPFVNATLRGGTLYYHTHEKFVNRFLIKFI